MKVYKQLANTLTDALIYNSIIEENKRAIYNYCYEYFIEQVVYTILILLAGVITHTFDKILIFLCIFSYFRRYGGGVHASTEKLCTLTSVITYTIVIIILPILQSCNRLLLISTFIISIICLCILAPVDNKNKRFNISEKKVLKQKCLIGAIICTAVYFVFFAFMLYPYCATISICTSIITISLALGVLIQEG